MRDLREEDENAEQNVVEFALVPQTRRSDADHTAPCF